MSETRTVSPTLEERLAQIIRGRLVLARPPFGFPEVQALTDEILAAAKEHGLVIGEGAENRPSLVDTEWAIHAMKASGGNGLVPATDWISVSVVLAIIHGTHPLLRDSRR